MLVGSYQHKLDGKGRMVLPSRFREDLGQVVMASVGYDSCVHIYPMEKWNEQLEKVRELDTFKEKSRTFRRYLMASAHNLEIDGMGRILIPQVLRNYGSIQQDVWVIGNEDWVEIWDQQKWERELAKIQGNFGALAEEVASR